MQISSQSQLFQDPKPWPEKGVDIVRILKQTTKNIFQKQLDMLNSQELRLESYLHTLNNILNRIAIYKQQCQQRSIELTNEISILEQNITTYKEFSPNHIHLHQQAQIQKKKELFLQIWHQRINIAHTIDVQKFVKIKIQDKLSLANQVFKLILLVFYNEPLAKYYWPNFKQQAFKNDHGNDFIERMARMDSRVLKSEQLSSITSFLANYDSIRKAKQLQPALQEVDKVHQIVIRYLRCHKLSRQMDQSKLMIEKERENIVEKDDQIQRQQLRLEALISKEKDLKKFIELITRVEMKIKSKQGDYIDVSQRIIMAKQALKKDRNQLSMVRINDQDLQQEYCQCNFI